MRADTIARLKITLNHMKPPVWRRIEVPLSLRLDRLHLAIQGAMGWTNSHLYEIRSGDVGWGMIDPDGDDYLLDARKARLSDIVEDAGTKPLTYLYDFGEDWEHTVKIERLVDREASIEYPRLIDASGRCPPEDVGGPGGYHEFLDALRDPEHERHAQFREWFGDDDFDPKVVDINALTEAVAALVKAWAPKIRARRARRPK
ncbi:MAG: plasmid pRiA4b ORF-3 family protein [Pseudomonadota bacterium]|nr:plasmid pRiA4b ORF-3 family protein [Pseudomonadota bacterium]